MTDNELIHELRRMHKSAKHGEANAMLVLFGIMYADELDASELSINEIALRATDRKGPYVRAGTKVAKYVKVKSNARI